MSAEKKHFIFIAVCCCLLVTPGVLLTYAGGATATVEITGRVLLTAFNVDATNVNSSAETITWMTNGLTNSTVEYGLNTAYGSEIIVPDEWVTSHTITLDGLSGGTQYHYRVVSSDSAGTTCTSSDFNFTTPAAKSLTGGSLGSSGSSASSIGNIMGLPAVDLKVSPPAVTIVSGSPIPLTADNLVAEPVVIVSGDKSASLSIDLNTQLLDQYGQPLSSIDLTRIVAEDVPAVPKGSVFIFSGYAYQIEPSGATFSPPITLKISMTPEEWVQVPEQDLSIQYYNPVSGLWEALSTTTDPATHSVTTMIAHASDYGLFIRSASPGTPSATTTTTAMISPPDPVQGVISDFNWTIIVQGLALITAIIVIASIGLYFYRKQGEH